MKKGYLEVGKFIVEIGETPRESAVYYSVDDEVLEKIENVKKVTIELDADENFLKLTLELSG